MKTIIFKSEKNAKVYEIRSAKNQGIYSANELVRKVKTDKIESLLEDQQYELTATEVK
jgi:nucleoid-associated protein YgaU